MTPPPPIRSPRRLRTTLTVIALLVAGIGFAAGLAALTTRIATPEIGLRGIPTLGEVAPAPPAGEPARTSDRPASVPAPTTTTQPPPSSDDDPRTEDDDSGRGRGRGRGRGSDDDDD